MKDTNNHNYIHNCNNELLEQEKNQLINDIVYGQYKNYFQIYDIEARCRKTRTAEEALAKLVDTTDKNAIFVRRSNVDCDESATIINNLVGERVALAYYNEAIPLLKREAVQRDFPNYRILVITHQNYSVLAQNHSKKTIFIKDRSVLVIDEHISDFKKISIDRATINSIKQLLRYDSEIYLLFIQFISSIEDFIRKNPYGKYFTKLAEQPFYETVNLLNKLIRNNFTDSLITLLCRNIVNSHDVLLEGKDIEEINYDFLNNLVSKKQLCDCIEDIKEFYKNPCVYNNNTLYTTDSKCKNWLLDNNILLDASGELQIDYNDNKQSYHLTYCPKVLDHSNWTIINYPVNSITANKNKIINYYDMVNAIISRYDTNDTLVVGNQNDIQYITSLPNENKAYFGNLTGSNNWADLSNVVIIQTPNIDDVDYMLRYIHSAKNYINGNLYKWSTKKIGRGVASKYEFTSPKFEEIRTRFIAEQTYQAIKRVNRNMSKITHAVIFMNNEDVIRLLQEHLTNCTVKVIDDTNFTFIETKQEQYIKDIKSKSYATRFIDLLVELSVGEHPELQSNDGLYLKKDIREYLGINTSANFSNRVLNNTDVIKYCETRNIDISGKYIHLNNYHTKSAS